MRIEIERGGGLLDRGCKELYMLTVVSTCKAFDRPRRIKSHGPRLTLPTCSVLNEFQHVWPAKQLGTRQVVVRPRAYISYSFSLVKDAKSWLAQMVRACVDLLANARDADSADGVNFFACGWHCL